MCFFTFKFNEYCLLFSRRQFNRTGPGGAATVHRSQKDSWTSGVSEACASVLGARRTNRFSDHDPKSFTLQWKQMYDLIKWRKGKFYCNIFCYKMFSDIALIEIWREHPIRSIPRGRSSWWECFRRSLWNIVLILLSCFLNVHYFVGLTGNCPSYRPSEPWACVSSRE